MITVGTRIEKAQRLVEIAEAYDDVYFTVGTHPHEAAGEAAADFAAMRRFAAHPKCVGIGEAGLDYHYNYAPPEVAKGVFRGQIGLARELGLPLVIHTREAEDDTAAILREEMGQGTFAALLHCFTSSRALAETALDLGLSISFSGVVTFKKSDELRAIARDVPLDRILVETDAPYLAPVPHRGKRNEPAYVAATARAVAEAKGMAPEALAEAARANTLSLFSRIAADGGRAGEPHRHDPRLRLVRRRAARRAGLGRLRPGQSANRRRRCALLIERVGEAGVTTVLIDVGPDIREQLIGADVRRVDGVLITHPHADHTHGIDDLRPLYHTRHARVDIHMDEPTALRVWEAFAYVFETPEGSSYPPMATISGSPPGARARFKGLAERSRRFRSISTTARSTRSGSASGSSPIRLTSNAFPRRAGRCSKGSTCGSSTRSAIARIRRISASRRRSPRSRRCGRSARS